ncbi:hypothetical protein FRB98_000761 [Tulasnella sp. 332]|nr:hypothetical protein FRB98_000761 [Tulasnella sp. 332]
MEGNRRKSSSSSLLVFTASFVPTVLGVPVSLPFLYPPASLDSASPSSSRSNPRRQQQQQRRLGKRWIDPTSQQIAKTLALKYKPGPTGGVRYCCWTLQGRSNCLVNSASSTPGDPEQGTEYCSEHDIDGSLDNRSVADNSIDAESPPPLPPPPPPPPPPPSNNNASTSTYIPTSTGTATSTTTTSAETVTTDPYIMTFQVTNIPSGWRAPQRTSYYSKRLIIGFSVSLAALIILTIIGCVVWRLKVARGRKDMEKQLARKKEQIRREMAGVDSGDEEGEGEKVQDRRSRSGKKKRSAWKRLVTAPNDNAGDDTSVTTATATATAIPSSKSRLIWRPKRRPRKQAAATVIPSSNSASSSAVDTTATGNADADADVIIMTRNTDDSSPDLSRVPSDRGPVSPTLTRPPTTGALSVVSAAVSITPTPSARSVTFAASPPAPLAAPMHPPTSTTTTTTTINTTVPRTSARPATSNGTPLLSPPNEEDAAGHDDDGGAEDVMPPAYRRRNFNTRTRPVTAPARVGSTRPQSSRSGKEREMDVPEEYASLAVIIPRADGDQTEATRRLTFNSQGHVASSPTLHEEEEEELEDEGGDAEEQEEGGTAVRRERISAHVATDDKQVLSDLRLAASAPSAPPPEDDATGEEEGTSTTVLRAVELPEWEGEDDDEWEDEGAEAGPSMSTPSAPQPETTTTTPAMTLHLPLPPPPTIQRSVLPRYLSGDHAAMVAAVSGHAMLPRYEGGGEASVFAPHEKQPIIPTMMTTFDTALLLPSAPPQLDAVHYDDTTTASAPPPPDE